MHKYTSLASQSFFPNLKGISISSKTQQIGDEEVEMSTEQIIELLGKQLQAQAQQQAEAQQALQKQLQQQQEAATQRHVQELQQRDQQMQQMQQELQQRDQQMQQLIATMKPGEDKVAVNIPKFIPFESSQELWSDYWSSFQTFLSVQSIPDEKQAQLFLSSQSRSTYKILSNLAFQRKTPCQVQELGLDDIETYMKEQYDPCWNANTVKERLFGFNMQLDR